LIDCLSKLKGHKLQFCQDQLNEIINAKQKDINWMEKQLGCSLAENNEQQQHPMTIKTEADLLTYNPEDVAWLIKQLDPDTVSTPTYCQFSAQFTD